MIKPLTGDSNKTDHNDGILERQAASAFGARLRARTEELSRTMTDIARDAGIKRGSMTGYWAGDRMPGSDKLFALADALEVDARWLVSGETGRPANNPLMDAADADFVGLPRYDLGQIGESGKGHRIETIPFRRDWLTRRVGTASGLWVAELFASYDELGLQEGDAVICSDIPRDVPPPDNTTCIFLGEGLFVARYRNRWTSETGDNTGPRVGPLDLRDHEVQPIARIRARLLSGI